MTVIQHTLPPSLANASPATLQGGKTSNSNPLVLASSLEMQRAPCKVNFYTYGTRHLIKVLRMRPSSMSAVIVQKNADSFQAGWLLPRAAHSPHSAPVQSCWHTSAFDRDTPVNLNWQINSASYLATHEYKWHPCNGVLRGPVQYLAAYMCVHTKFSF